MSLFHYTNISSLQSILLNQELWISHIDYMNDPQELQGGLDVFELASKLLVQIAESKSRDDKEGPIPNPFENFKETAQRMNIFVGSFTTKGNLLSQWKYYGDYAIEFDEELIHEITNDITKLGDAFTEMYFRTGAPESIELDKGLIKGSMQEVLINHDDFQKYAGLLKATFDNCIYDDDDMLTLALDVLVKNILTLSSNIKDGQLREVGTVAKQFFEMYLHAALYKHNGYEEEGEKRVVVLSSDDAKFSFRIHNDSLMPYYKLKFPINCIKSISIGPRDIIKQEKDKKSLEIFLKHTYKNYPNAIIPKIKLSSIPLRR